ncbi:unnamed protein product [Rotaria socialis]|uniref:Uncharacterized protein n=1 Tax=Rotaria socialis TaxID=392032 RepID=A0A821I0Z2_9BILA|nr:unnamed protein product [Rotaria socialis]
MVLIWTASHLLSQFLEKPVFTWKRVVNPVNTVDCFCDLVKNNLCLHSTSDISPKEREIAKHLCETIVTFNKCKRFEYEEETTLDLDEMSDDYENEVNDNIFHDNDSSEADDEWGSEGKEREAYSVKGYSLEYMKQVVGYAGAKDSSASGKLTPSLVAYWRDNCLLPSIGDKCLLLSDS